MLETVVKSLTLNAGLGGVRKVIVFDGFNLHPQIQYKSGRVIDPSDYQLYRAAVRDLAASGSNPYFSNTELVFLEERIGFGPAVRLALESHASTPFVCVVQHDYHFARPAPISALIAEMVAHADINYISFPASATKNYLTVKSEFVLGLASRGVHLSLTVPEKGFSVPLVRLLFWYDKPHIARRDYYLRRPLERAGPEGKGLVGRGDFIEDTFGHLMLQDIKARGNEAHDEYGAYLWMGDQDGLVPTLQHINGRTFLLPHQRKEREAASRAMHAALDAAAEAAAKLKLGGGATTNSASSSSSSTSSSSAAAMASSSFTDAYDDYADESSDVEEHEKRDDKEKV